MQSFGNLDIHFVNYKNSKAFCYLLISQTKKLAKDWCLITFLDNFIFFLAAIHEKHKFKYLKNLTVKVCKICCNDVYMSILQCDIFLWQLIDMNVFIRYLTPRSSSENLPFSTVSTVLHVIISKQDIQICQIFHIYLTTLSSVLSPKYTL